MIIRSTKSILKNCTYVRYGLILLFFILSSIKSNAQDNIDYSFYGKYIYHFTKYINWPDSKKGDFIVAIVGQGPANKAIQEALIGKKVGNQNIVVKVLDSDADFSSVSIIYLAGSLSSQVGPISAKANAAKAILITEKQGLARKGADISFFIKEEKLKFELNKSTVENKGLKIATELLKLAVVI